MIFYCKTRSIIYVFTIIDYETTQSEIFDARNGELISMELKDSQSATEYQDVLKMLGYCEIN